MKNIGQDHLSEVKDKFDKHIYNAKLSKTIHLAAHDKSKTDSSFLCTSFDLQNILNTTHGDSMLLFHLGRTRWYARFNEICTIIDKYLMIVEDRKTVKTLTLFCDSCPGQNKNNVVFAAIFWFMNKKANNINKVSITYLQPGHTYMPVDSVHSTIESNLKKKIVWAPSEWPRIIVNSRNKPKPYEVFFKSYRFDGL